MIRLRMDQKILILGDYETGKTTFAKWLLPQMKRCLVWDPTFAFQGGSKNWEDVKKQFEDPKNGRAIFWPGRGNLESKMEAFCEYALKQHSAMVFIDEPAMLGTSHQLPQAFVDLHRLGHKRGLGMTIATHSVWDLPHVTHQAHHTFAFRIDRPVDQNVLKQILKEGGAEWVKDAPQYHFWHRGGGHEGPVQPISIGSKGVTHGQSTEKPLGASSQEPVPIVRGTQGTEGNGASVRKEVASVPEVRGPDKGV